ncbi:MAG: DnaJ domain-containing protein [Symplocastrum torsivum CPER-KK1]|jgi:tetratricopeptide (TPR) repeat protein|uniref:DnaJ domain-containing protein n=1 Tax=Symplocastrum torsivum CPER-KK1 TaxID=450513 RepID=A0A951UAM1_9CYAN|nr:DnaJ domain-containing protein [Symplocastrum torsivum CPER-KK1]
MQDSRDYYKILEISREATIEEIKEAYRRLAREYHPDLHPDNPTAAERFKEICQAYEVLSDSVQRTQYDQGFDPSINQRKKQGRSSQDFYVRAVAKALDKDYQGAVEDYTQAIDLNPRFIEAYIKRGAMRYKLGDARGALKDCNEALSINPNLAQAYYYQGRSRYRLGYTQAAIEAYTQAIAQEGDYAQAYYHRGLANNDLNELPLAVEDLQKAAELFREQGDRTGYQLAQETLKSLSKTQGKLRRTGGNATAVVRNGFGEALRAFKSLALNPVGGMLPTFVSLGKQQAIAVGIVFAGIFDLCFVCGAYLGWRDFFEASIPKLMLIGVVPFISVAVISAIARGIFRRKGSFAGDIFLAGASLLPLSFLLILSGIVSVLPSYTLPIVSVFATCYTIFTLYSGCTQLSNLSDRSATFIVPVMLLVSGWFSYFAFTSLLL